MRLPLYASPGLLSFSLSCTVSVLLLVGCGGGTCDDGVAAADFCGPPHYGYARVEGSALSLDGSPISGRDAYVGCGDAVGAYSDRTDNEGGFRVNLIYAVFDTLRHPFPPREPDGGFILKCVASLALRSGAILVDSLSVHFAPSRTDVVPSNVELREGPESLANGVR
jgi:hypothetical protein